MINLNVTERKGYKYINQELKLLPYFDKIDDKKSHFLTQPDLITFRKQQFEIKRLQRGFIVFTRIQLKRFNDDVIIIIFKPFENKPYLRMKFSEIKKYLIFNSKNDIYSCNINKYLKEKNSTR